MNITAAEAAEAAQGKLICGNGETRLSHISLNSNGMQGGDLFVPIIGERVDAHKFLAGAFQNGAVCAFTSRHKDAADVAMDEALFAYQENGGALCLIAVDDTKAALQRLGRRYRKAHVHIPLIGVTGSVGKTTTREMIACALSSEKRVYATKGNSNSQVGVPVTMTETDETAQIGVIELGMSEFHEMSRISEVACVDAAVMTNIGISHIGQLGTQENILIEKLHILDGMPDGAPLIVNGDDAFLAALTEEKIHAYGIAEKRRIPIVFYGTGENADYRAEHISLKDGLPQFEIACRNGERIACALKVPGMHMVLNAAAAVAAAEQFGVKKENAAKALAAFTGVGGRGQIFAHGGVTFIDDSYNAAPSSMKAGLSVLCDLPAKGRKIAVLADMLELGENEAAYHKEVGAYIRKRGLSLDEICLYGPLSVHIAEGVSAEADSEGKGGKTPKHSIRIRHFETKEALLAALSETLSEGDCVLLKGSNSMGLSSVLKQLLEKERF